jgi:hypothetical protein
MVLALDRAATVTGWEYTRPYIILMPILKLFFSFMLLFGLVTPLKQEM